MGETRDRGVVLTLRVLVLDLGSSFTGVSEREMLKKNRLRKV